MKKLCDESFWKQRVKKYYPASIKDRGNQNWKNFYLSLVYYIDKLKREFGFEFTKDTKGDPKQYYDILSARYADEDKAAEAVRINAIDLIDFLIKIIGFNFIIESCQLLHQKVIWK